MDELSKKVDRILKIIESTSSSTDSSTIKFDVNMYIRCLIHELRTPITTVSLGLNLIEQQILAVDCKSECGCAEQLNIVRDLYKTVQYIDNTLTKFCVVQDGNLVLNAFEPFSLRVLMQGVEKILQYNIKEKNIVFECNIDDSIHDYVYGDGFNIKHCIINLIKNAIKYSNPTRSNKIVVNVSSNVDSYETQEQTVVISIMDNNDHIPKHIKDKLFEPFNSSSGSGLGLYICKKILELHSGLINHGYLDNTGNQFSIVIKLTKCDYNAAIEPKSSTSILSAGPSNMSIKYNIIIVDDSDIILKMMTRIFKNNPKINKIYTATDGFDAIRQICSNSDIDIVFIDNQMPNLDGTQTVQMLRGNQFNKLVIGITGSNSNELSKFYTCGIDYVFSKPLDETKLNLIFSFLEGDDICRYPNKTLRNVGSQLVWI
jgi:CheY-like chemotaxis protein